MRACPSLVRAVSLAAGFALAPHLHGADWPQWRGPELRGSSPERGLPLRWTAQQNVAFKLALPSGGASTPVVLGDRIFVNVADGDTVQLWSVDRRSGAVLWKRPLGSAAGQAHRKHDMATPSPVGDGQRVFALTGNGALKGFDMIVNGECDSLPEQAFYMVGTIEEAFEKAKTLS